MRARQEVVQVEVVDLVKGHASRSPDFSTCCCKESETLRIRKNEANRSRVGGELVFGTEDLAGSKGVHIDPNDLACICQVEEFGSWDHFQVVKIDVLCFACLGSSKS